MQPTTSRRTAQAKASAVTVAWIGAVFVVTAWSNIMGGHSLPDEDAYITYVFSSNLATGNGLTYNGVQVEGFTNLLMALVVSLVSLVTGLQPASAGAVVSFFFTFVSFAFFFAILERCLETDLGPTAARRIALGAVACLAVNPHVTFWAFSGMESSLVTAVVFAALHAHLCGWDRLFIACVSVLPLVRFDAVVIAVAMVALPAMQRIVEAAPGERAARIRGTTRQMVMALAVALAPFAASMVFRMSYYGDSVPNTAYVKFFARPLGDRLFEGLVYAWNALWSSMSVWYLAATGAWVAWGRFRRTRIDVMLAGVIAVGLAHVIYVGGDVGWKPFYRFSHLTINLVLLLHFLAPKSRRVSVHLASLAVVFVLSGWVQAPTVASGKTPYVRELVLNYVVEPTSGLRQLVQWPEFGHRLSSRLADIATDFPEDVLAATGKYLRAVSGGADRLITSAAGKVVYYSGLRAIDVTGLADVEWRTAGAERRLELVRASRYLVFHTNDNLCSLPPFLVPNTELRLRAVFYSHTAYPGLYVLVFATPEAIATELAEVGDRVRFVRRDVPFGDSQIAFYTERWDGPTEIVNLYAATRCLQS